MKNLKTNLISFVFGTAIASVTYADTTTLKCNCGFKEKTSYEKNIQSAVGADYSIECAHEFDITTTKDIDIEEKDAQINVPNDAIITDYADSSTDEANWSTFSIGPRDDEKLKSVTDYNDNDKVYTKDNYSGDWKKNKLNEFTLKLNDENASYDRVSNFNIETSGKDYEGFVIVHAESSDPSVTNTIYGLCLENKGHEGGDEPIHVASTDKPSKKHGNRKEHKRRFRS